MLPRKICFLGLLWLVEAIPAVAQYPGLPVRSGPAFSELTATDDGKSLFFTSLQILRREPEGRFQETRLYRYDSDGVTLFAERGNLAPKNGFSSNDGVAAPQVSADGQTVAYTLQDICLDGRKCVESIGQEAVLQRGSDIVDLGHGSVQLSRNGRWALIRDESMKLLDLQSGTAAEIANAEDLQTRYFQPSRMISSDGSVLFWRGDTLGIWRAGKFTPLDLPGNVIRLSDDGRKAFMQTEDLFAVDLATGVRTQVAAGSRQILDVTADGRFLLLAKSERWFNVGGPVDLVDSVTGESERISLEDGESGTSGALAGGDVAFIATTSGRIVKFSRVAGTLDTLFPPAMQCELSNALVPGSFVSMTCSQDVKDWEGRILVSNEPATVLTHSDKNVSFQVSWETLANGYAFPSLIRFQVPGDAPFHAETLTGVFSFYPEFIKADPAEKSWLGLKFYNADWSALLTAQPRPGEIINAYMTGLGRVNGAMQTGVPAPDGVIAPIRETLKCHFSPQTQPAETIFAGLAPGMIGIYQATFRMPADDSQVMTSASCNVPTAGGVVFGVPAFP